MGKLKTFYYTVGVVISLCITRAVSAFEPEDTGLVTTGSASGYNTDTNVMEQVGKVVNAFLAVLGVILFIIIFYGGILYLTAGGDTKRVDEGKKYIINGIIGVVIISIAYALSTYVLTQVITATS